MGRKPTRNHNLPKGMRARHRGKFGTYYYLDTGENPRREILLGKDYVEAVRKWADLSAVPDDSRKLITFRYVAERYIQDELQKKAPRTQKDNLKELDWLYKFFDDPPCPIDEIEPTSIVRYLEWRTAKVRGNREKALFSHIWNYSRSKGFTKMPNPCTGIRNNKEAGRDIYIDDEVLAAVYDCACDPLQDALDLAYLTAQRPADVLKYLMKDVKEGALWTKQNKRGAKIRVAIKGELAKLIDRITARKVVGVSLLNNEKGQRLTASMLRTDFNDARIKAKEKYPHLADDIGKFQFRDLRAKAATDKEEEKGMEATQAQLGHASATMTAHYVRHRKGKLVDPTK